MRRSLVLVATLLAASVARAEPLDDELDTLQAEDARVAAVGYRLVTANLELCAARGPASGLALHDALQYGPRDRPAAMRHFGLNGAPGVLAVAPGSPAEAAGIKAGDLLLGVGGDIGFDVTPPPVDAPASEAGVDAAFDRLDRALSGGSAKSWLSRQGRVYTVQLGSTPACAYRFQVYPSSVRNASANGQTVLVSTALVRYAVRDEDLAVALGHELAHSVLAHVQHPIGSSRSRERAADYLGLYLTARAGYDISGASAFWRRFGADDWRARGDIFTHPSASARAKALARTTAEIQAKRAAGQPLLPDGVGR
ncbi:MAG: M48 family metalloprotease [Parcubacteria group bacterium]